jgi:hypothetical protein
MRVERASKVRPWVRPDWWRLLQFVIGRWVFVTSAYAHHGPMLNTYGPGPWGRRKYIGIACYWGHRGLSWVWPLWLCVGEPSDG